MIKEQLIKHKEVIKWWLDNPDKGVWYKEEAINDWLITHRPEFDLDTKYVQNDEYAEYRKALVDGKIIEYTLPNIEQWNIVDNLKQHFSDCFIYRIKPKFELNDWIIDEKGDKIYLPASTNKKWKPKHGEWCVFWDKDICEYFLAKYGTKHIVNDFSWGEDSWYYTEQYWNNIAPIEFINIIEDY